MSDNEYSIAWLEEKLELFESEKSALALELHNRSGRRNVLSWVLLGLTAAALVFAVLLSVVPGKLLEGLFRSGANVDVLLTSAGALMVACSAAAVLFCSGKRRLIAAAIGAAMLIAGLLALLRLPGRVGPIPISDEDGLNSINRFKLASYVLADDIVLERGTVITSFGGILDGDGHSVSGNNGLRIGVNYGTVKGLRFTACELAGGDNALCGVNRGRITDIGFAEDVHISNIRALIGTNRGAVDKVSAGALFECGGECGGIVGDNLGRVEYCDFYGVISGAAAGGIVYDMKGGTVANCINRGSFTGCSEDSGGIAYKQSGGAVEKCFADMTVKEGKAYPICGNSAGGTITRCYAVDNEAFIPVGDCVLLARTELVPSRLIGFDLENTWLVRNGSLVLRGMEAAEPAPLPTEQPTAEPTQTSAPEPTASPEPETPSPTLVPQELYGELDVYPAADEMLGEQTTGSIHGTSVNIRSGPSSSNGIVFRLDGGTEVSVIAKQGEWYFIGHDGAFGWVHSQKLSMN